MIQGRTQPTAKAPIAIVTDFDGTACLDDIGDLLCARLDPAAYQRFEQALSSGGRSLAQAQRDLWPQIEVEPTRLEALLDELVRLRPGFERLCHLAARRRTALTIASAGFRFYIEHALKRFDRTTRAHLDVIANDAYFDEEHGRFRLEFARPDRFACPRCSVCKARVLRAFEAKGYRTVFCGDGRSDRCALGVSAELFVVEGSKLHRLAEREGIDHTPFSSYDTVIAALESDRDDEGDQTMTTRR